MVAWPQERDACRRGRDRQRIRIVFGQKCLEAGEQGVIRQPLDHVGVALLLPARASPLRPPREQRSWWRVPALRGAVRIPAKRAAAGMQRDGGRLLPGSLLRHVQGARRGLGSVAGGVLLYLCGYHFLLRVVGLARTEERDTAINTDQSAAATAAPTHALGHSCGGSPRSHELQECAAGGCHRLPRENGHPMRVSEG